MSHFESFSLHVPRRAVFLSPQSSVLASPVQAKEAEFLPRISFLSPWPPPAALSARGRFCGTFLSSRGRLGVCGSFCFEVPPRKVPHARNHLQKQRTHNNGTSIIRTSGRGFALTRVRVEATGASFVVGKSHAHRKSQSVPSEESRDKRRCVILSCREAQARTSTQTKFISGANAREGDYCIYCVDSTCLPSRSCQAASYITTARDKHISLCTTRRN